MNRTFVVKARLTEEEYKRFVQLVEKSDRPQNKSEYIRACIFSEDVKRSSVVVREFKNMNYQIRKIGVLINQIAASANRGVWYPGDAELVLKKLEEVETAVKEFQRTLGEL